jgi:hypothetical protein
MTSASIFRERRRCKPAARLTGRFPIIVDWY